MEVSDCLMQSYSEGKKNTMKILKYSVRKHIVGQIDEEISQHSCCLELCKQGWTDLYEALD